MILKVEFVITPDLQEWATETIFPKASANGIRKVVFVTSHDLFSEIGIQQAMEGGEGVFSTKYFTEKDEARSWLLEN